MADRSLQRPPDGRVHHGDPSLGRTTESGSRAAAARAAAEEGGLSVDGGPTAARSAALRDDARGGDGRCGGGGGGRKTVGGVCDANYGVHSPAARAMMGGLDCREQNGLLAVRLFRTTVVVAEQKEAFESASLPVLRTPTVVRLSLSELKPTRSQWSGPTPEVIKRPINQ